MQPGSRLQDARYSREIGGCRLTGASALESAASSAMPNIHRTYGCLVLLAASVLAPGWAVAADDKSPNRYPFDPVCAWGRLADGKGMVVRCLTQAEAVQLIAAKSMVPSGTNIGAIAGNQSTPSGTTPGASAETTDKKSATDVRAEPLEVDVVNVTADEGTLPIARKKLHLPRDKYARCVADNGGLATESGEVTVRFLVRERGRAEGTSVEKRSGVSEAAARCIAGVVDRRPVGTPEGPAVGATAVFRVTKQSKRRAETATGR